MRHRHVHRIITDMVGLTRSRLDDLRSKTVHVPAEIDFYLGVLHGEMNRAMGHVCQEYEREIQTLRNELRRIRSEKDSG